MVVSEYFIFTSIVDSHRVGNGEFNERTPEITAKPWEWPRIGQKNVTGACGCEKHIAPRSDLKSHFRNCLHELDEVSEIQFALVEP